MSKEITQAEAAIAWAQKKIVEACSPVNDIWCRVTPVGAAVEKCPRNHYPADVFTSDLPFRFRLATVPPEKKFRHWKPLEVPVGAQIRAIGLRWRGLILSVSANGEIHCMTGFIPTEHALANHEHSTDGGKTWLPCGVEVVAS